MTGYVIAGLGNPGAEHAGQRHNVGFWCINRLAKRHGIDLKAGRSATTGKGEIAGAEAVLVKPRTYVNRSGTALKPILDRERVPVENLIILYDELDLPEGRIRLRPSGGDGGHNGLKSIVAATGSGDFGRIRIGIGRPKAGGVPTWDPGHVMRWVLADPPKDSQEVLDEAVERACDAIESIIGGGWERAMNKYNTVEET
ncbi:MAG: aminoacyl-tRNA hydrolase [Dehalococcoidia bacterium]|nr:aminoacyl-tRNA hydrolase [Dehalococcoidia bacterium]